MTDDSGTRIIGPVSVGIEEFVLDHELERMADQMRAECGFTNAKPWSELDEAGREVWLYKIRRVLRAAGG